MVHAGWGKKIVLILFLLGFPLVIFILCSVIWYSVARILNTDTKIMLMKDFHRITPEATKESEKKMDLFGLNFFNDDKRLKRKASKWENKRKKRIHSKWCQKHLTLNTQSGNNILFISFPAFSRCRTFSFLWIGNHRFFFWLFFVDVSCRLFKLSRN